MTANRQFVYCLTGAAIALTVWGLALLVHVALPDNLSGSAIELALVGPGAIPAFAISGDDWPFEWLSFDAVAIIGSGCFYALLGLATGAYLGQRRQRNRREKLAATLP